MRWLSVWKWIRPQRCSTALVSHERSMLICTCRYSNHLMKTNDTRLHGAKKPEKNMTFCSVSLFFPNRSSIGNFFYSFFGSFLFETKMKDCIGTSVYDGVEKYFCLSTCASSSTQLRCIDSSSRVVITQIDM